MYKLDWQVITKDWPYEPGPSRLHFVRAVNRSILSIQHDMTVLMCCSMSVCVCYRWSRVTPYRRHVTPGPTGWSSGSCWHTRSRLTASRVSRSPGWSSRGGRYALVKNVWWLEGFNASFTTKSYPWVLSIDVLTSHLLDHLRWCLVWQKAENYTAQPHWT